MAEHLICAPYTYDITQGNTVWWRNFTHFLLDSWQGPRHCTWDEWRNQQLKLWQGKLVISGPHKLLLLFESEPAFVSFVLSYS